MLIHSRGKQNLLPPHCTRVPPHIVWGTPGTLHCTLLPPGQCGYIALYQQYPHRGAVWVQCTRVPPHNVFGYPGNMFFAPTVYIYSWDKKHITPTLYPGTPTNCVVLQYIVPVLPPVGVVQVHYNIPGSPSTMYPYCPLWGYCRYNVPANSKF